MEYPLQLIPYHFGSETLGLYTPEAAALQQHYTLQKQADPDTPFPYWSRVWESALVLAEFMVNQPQWIRDKTVLEIAGGLGLPALLAAGTAKRVTGSDYCGQAVELMERSRLYNKRENMDCRQLDFKSLPPDLSADTLLISDMNYDPADFEALQGLIHRWRAAGSRVLLSTPQRLVAKSFIAPLLPLAVSQQALTLPGSAGVFSVLVL